LQTDGNNKLLANSAKGNGENIHDLNYTQIMCALKIDYFQTR